MTPNFYVQNLLRADFLCLSSLNTSLNSMHLKKKSLIYFLLFYLQDMDDLKIRTIEYS